MFKKFILKVALPFLCTLTVINVFAQDNEINSREITHYVFAEFVQGKIKMKSGQVTDALLNYNSLTEEMIFMQNGTPMALDELQKIDTVFINNRKFIPANKVFYEVLTDTKITLCLEHKASVTPPGVETGFGTSQTAAATSLSDMKASGFAYKLKLPDDYKIVSKTVYWLKKDGAYISADNAKDFQAAFPDKAGAITDFVKTNKTKFKNVADVVKLTNFCNNQ